MPNKGGTGGGVGRHWKQGWWVLFKLIVKQPWKVEWSGVMAGSRSVVRGWAEDLEFNTYMIVKALWVHDLGNWNEFASESQKSQKDKNLCERMSYKIISAQQLGEMTWKLLSAGENKNKNKKTSSLPLYPGLRVFWVKVAFMALLCCQELGDVYTGTKSSQLLNVVRDSKHTV